MDVDGRASLAREASLPYWWERTRHIDIPQPKTEYVQVGRRVLREALDSRKLDVEPLLAAAEVVGGYPIFLRTDQMACKHSWSDTCYVESADAMLQHALFMLEENIMMDMAGEVMPEGLAVREFLDLDWSFRAFHGGMPMSTEVRTFVRDGKVECVHPYWPEGAVEKWIRSSREPDVPNDWEDVLAAQNAKTDRDIDVIRRQASMVAEAMDGWWSCDMALGRDDSTWHLIDMAPGAISYHWPSCEHVPDDQRQAADSKNAADITTPDDLVALLGGEQAAPPGEGDN